MDRNRESGCCGQGAVHGRWTQIGARLLRICCWDDALAADVRREGWDKGDEDGIETIVNHDLKKKIAVMNTDAGTADLNRTPVNRTLKGSATTRVVDLNNQGELFKKHEMGPYEEPPYSLWYLCMHDDKGKVRAELSMPIEFRDGYIAKFSERIFILQGDDWDKIILEQATGGPTQDYEINVRRK